MTKLLYSMAVVMLCLPSIAEAQQIQEVHPESIWEITVYPKEIYFGDPIYMGFHLKNRTGEVATDWVINGHHRMNFWLTLHSESISVPYHLLYESDMRWNPDHSGYRQFDFLLHDFQPGESMLVAVAYQELPTLEDMKHPFWEEAKKRLNASENTVAHIVGERPLRTPLGRSIPGLSEPFIHFVSDPIVIKSRPDSEMKLLEQWLEGTPEKLRPVSLDQFKAESGVIYYCAWENLKDQFDWVPFTPKPDFVSKTRNYKILRNARYYFASNERFIKVRGEEYFPYIFLRHGNRKPGDPVCPETWQGWKELEESLLPSTMRDEIRLTRILIQYCDTEDEAVLQELKDWFADMNELQRTVMANNFGDRISWHSSRYTKVLPQVQEIHRAIHEYDVIPVFGK